VIGGPNHMGDQPAVSRSLSINLAHFPWRVNGSLCSIPTEAETLKKQ
jgi:hypothetical protein